MRAPFHPKFVDREVRVIMVLPSLGRIIISIPALYLSTANYEGIISLYGRTLLYIIRAFGVSLDEAQVSTQLHRALSKLLRRQTGQFDSGGHSE